jgi:PUA domain protein
MPERFRRSFVKDKEARILLDKVSEKLKLDLRHVFGAKVGVEVVEMGFVRVFLFNHEPSLAQVDDEIFPTLRFEEFLAVAPKVVVDMGAVPYVCRGADVMAPGVRRFVGVFMKGDFVVVVDEKYGKALVVGEAFCDSVDAKDRKQGMVVRNVHFVGDRVWDFIKDMAIAVK